VNKDFFTKPISLKDINLKDIDLKKIKNKKEIVIGILILVYIIVIFCVGNSLLKERNTAKTEFAAKEIRYNSLKNAGTEAELKADIEKLVSEKEKLAIKVESISSNEFNDILDDFSKNAPIALTVKEISIRNSSRDLADYSIYSVSIGSFSGSLKQIESFLKYVEDYERIVRIDNLSFKKNQITGDMDGSMNLSFYFKKISE